MCAPKKPPSWFRLHTWFQLIVTTYVALGIIPVCQNLRHGFVYTTFILICGFVTIQLCKRNRGSDIKDLKHINICKLEPVISFNNEYYYPTS